MNKILLTAVAVLLATKPALSAPVGLAERLRTLWSIAQAAPRLQKLALAEIDVYSANVLRQLKITVPGFSTDPRAYDSALPPLKQARVLLHEQEALLAALARQHHTVKGELQKIIALTDEVRAMEHPDNTGLEKAAVIRFSRDDGTEEQHIIDKTRIESAIRFYIDKALYLTNEEAVVIDTREDPIYLLGFARRINEAFGVEMSYVQDRVVSRKMAGRKDLLRVLRELGKWHNNPSQAAYTNVLAAQRGLAVEIAAQAEPMVNNQDWPTMSLPGVEVKAKLYELAARIAASYHDVDKLAANLQSIIDLNNSTDSVSLTVNFKNIEVTLNEHTYATVKNLYHQAFAASSPND